MKPALAAEDRSSKIDAFLAKAGWAEAMRQPLAGDASFRRYERVYLDGKQAVLMDAPPPEDVRPFAHMTEFLAESGFHPPAILAADEAQGFLLLEDLGDNSYTIMLKSSVEPEPAIYMAAIDVIIALYKQCRQQKPELKIRAHDRQKQLAEASLLSDWFLPQILGREKALELREEYLQLWHTVLEATQPEQSTVILADYHADNLIWLEGEEGLRRVGLLDYQDAMWGDPVFDLLSLLEDARRDVQEATVQQCIGHFLRQTGMAEEDFAQRYAVLAAQRNSKIVGIFVRLAVRDGKAHYPQLLPRVWGHLQRDLQHPALADIREWLDKYVPAEARGAIEADVTIGGLV